jgi:hypothetical protein
MLRMMDFFSRPGPGWKADLRGGNLCSPYSGDPTSAAAPRQLRERRSEESGLQACYGKSPGNGALLCLLSQVRLGWNVFALEDGVVYHTYSRTAPDRFLLAPFYSQLLD